MKEYDYEQETNENEKILLKHIKSFGDKKNEQTDALKKVLFLNNLIKTNEISKEEAKEGILYIQNYIKNIEKNK